MLHLTVQRRGREPAGHSHRGVGCGVMRDLLDLQTTTKKVVHHWAVMCVTQSRSATG